MHSVLDSLTFYCCGICWDQVGACLLGQLDALCVSRLRSVMLQNSCPLKQSYKQTGNTTARYKTYKHIRCVLKQHMHPQTNTIIVFHAFSVGSKTSMDSKCQRRHKTTETQTLNAMTNKCKKHTRSTIVQFGNALQRK